MEETPETNRYMTADDFLKNAEDCPAVDELYKELREEAREQVLDEVQLRRQQDWGVVAHQVVGAESRRD